MDGTAVANSVTAPWRQEPGNSVWNSQNVLRQRCLRTAELPDFEEARAPLSSRLRGHFVLFTFGERTRDCSPGHAGKEGPQLARTGASQGFPRDAAPVGVSRRGTATPVHRPQRPAGSTHSSTTRAAPGKSGLHARGEGERVLALESREGTRASRRVEEGISRSGYSWDMPTENGCSESCKAA